MRHTPGPWRVIDREFSLTNAGERIVMAGEDRLCSVDIRNQKIKQKDRWNSVDEEREANARLIAAAPELLEALEGLAIAYRHDTTDYELSTEYVNAMKAIVKAKGE